MYTFKSFFKRISTDFRQKELLPLKLLFFVHSSTLYVLYPYLTIHMRELGINVEETAIMSAVTPIVAIIMPPVAGLIADRIGNFKVILSLFSGLGGAASLLLLLVPVGRTTIIFPKMTTAHMSCSQGNLSTSLLEPDACYKHSNSTIEFPFHMEACGLTCQFPLPGPLLNETNVRQLSDNRIFVPSDLETCSDLAKLKIRAAYRANPVRTMDILTASYPFNTTCEEVLEDVTLPIGNETLELVNCSTSWLGTLERPKVCTNPSVVKDLDIRLTFWLYLTIRVFIGMIGGTAFAMFEGAVIAILREHKADYGLQRIYATIGGMISSPVSGWLIDYASFNKGYTDFRPAFYLYAGLKIVSALLMLTINLEFKAPATNVLSDVITVLRKVEIVGLLITCFILGTAWGYIESFLFWLLQDLGASRSLMGITITVGGIAGLPLLVMSGPIIDRIGHANVLFIGFIFYAIRLIGYSLIYNPWHCLIFEAMESVTSSLAFTAAVTYAAKLSTTTTDSSIQGLLGGLYFGVGKGSGSLIGGYLMKGVGTRPTYQIFAAVTLITGCLYYLFNKFYVERRTQEDVKVEVTEKGLEVEGMTKKSANGGETMPMKCQVGSGESNGYQSTKHLQADGSANNPAFEPEQTTR